MIVKQFKNRSFRSTLDYVLGKESAQLLSSNMGGTTPRQLAKEFAAARQLRPNLQRACGHIVLSIPHRDALHPQGEYHEHLNDEQYVEIAQKWLQGMEFLGEGLHRSQYVIIRHHDTDHEHLHIVASRIRMDSSVVPDSWDYRRSEVVVRQLEKEFGLEPTPCSNEQVANKVKLEYGIEAAVCDRSAQTSFQKHHSSRKPPVKQLLADAIDAATVDLPTVTLLIARLQEQGIMVHPQFSTLGKFKEAVAFELSGVKVAGNKLGKAYSFPGLLKKRGVDYNPDRDLPALRAAAVGKKVQMPRTPAHQEDSLVPEKLPDYTHQEAPADEPPNSPVLDVAVQQPQPNYAAVIAPTIRLLWQHRNGSERIIGNHYELYQFGQTLRLKRTTGEIIASIPLNREEKPQSLGLTLDDLLRFERLRQWLDERLAEREKEQQLERQISWDLER